VPFPDALTGDPTLRGELMLPTEICSSLPALSESAYKKRRGTVTVFAGERGKAGAAMLASEAALAARAGLVHLIVDTELYSSVASAEKAVMVHPRSEAWEREPSYECLLVGCGWGVSLHRRILLPRLLGSSIRGVVDADGLNLLATMPRRPLGNDWVLTPHIGELARLLQCSTSEVSGDLVETTIEAAKAWQCVVVGKSHVVAIASPDGDHLVVDGMNTAMGTGGSGDVLAGIVAGLLANGMSGIDAARYGVGLHQRAGSLLREHAGFFSADRLVLQVAKLSDRPGE
ncbi:MAG: NAD(P)H-hydrate dehydratase, partial [Spirochaetota bacterium]